MHSYIRLKVDFLFLPSNPKENPEKNNLNYLYSSGNFAVILYITVHIYTSIECRFSNNKWDCVMDVTLPYFLVQYILKSFLYQYIILFLVTTGNGCIHN